MDNYRDDGFDRSSQCFQEIIQLIALNSRHCNTFCWRRELNHTENGKVLREKALKMKGHLLALRLRPTPLTYTLLRCGDNSLHRQPSAAGSSQCGIHVPPHTVPALPLSPTPRRSPHANHTATQVKEDRVLMSLFLS